MFNRRGGGLKVVGIGPAHGHDVSGIRGEDTEGGNPVFSFRKQDAIKLRMRVQDIRTVLKGRFRDEAAADIFLLKFRQVRVFQFRTASDSEDCIPADG